ncbi:hypothetical protein LCGC14_1202050 [marine sediment metagenome]|uniref:Uncharacterized protein n=1 Tax=marine sediment metagenome TaxID=412755 RepID=A0A0F9LL08_9ZZZZ
MARKKKFKFAGTSTDRKSVKLSDGIIISVKQHDTLLKYLKERLDFGKPSRDRQADRFEIIDREISGYINLDAEDKKRERENIAGRGPFPTDTSLPLTMAQLHEALTYAMTVIAPDSGMYAAIALAEKQDVAKGFATLMNRNAKKFKHYRNLAKGIFDMLKYNIGGYTIDWVSIFGNMIENAKSGGIEINKKMVFSGNEILAIDQYNLICDISVSPTDLPIKGEFFSIVDVKTPFRLKKMEADGEIFGIKDVIKQTMSPEISYYRRKPVIHIDHSGRAKGDSDWFSILSMTSPSQEHQGIELINIVTWLIPNDFGLSKSKDFEIWRFTIGNSVKIVSAIHLNNAHGYLPCAFGMPWDDGFGLQTKSFAEHLNPFQRFASFQMNIHQKAARKKLYGVTIYNKNIIDLGGFDPVASTIPARPTGMKDFDLRRAFVQFTDAPNTENTLRDIDATDALMQKILPTDMLRQVASLERATQYQAAAVVQGANRRNHLIVKILDDQCFSVIRDIQLYNVFQFQTDLEVIDESGKLVTINPADFIEAGLEFDISDGLKGIDKLIIIEGFKDIINMMLQSQIASEQVDIVAIIDYWTSILGDKTDFSQFKFKNEFDKLGQQEKQAAFQLFQQAVQQQEAQKGGGGNV